MTSSNLPPGVNVNMIPGNRPEDETEEAFWNVLSTLFAKKYPSFDEIISWLRAEPPAMVELEVALDAYVVMAKDIGYATGFDEGRAEEQMSRGAAQEETEYLNHQRVYSALLHKAGELGHEDGVAKASSLLDGNSSDEQAWFLLKGIKDGDPEVWDSLPGSPLSGEFSGEKVPKDVLDELDLDEEHQDAEDAIVAYEDGFSQGVSDGATNEALRFLGFPQFPTTP